MTMSNGLGQCNFKERMVASPRARVQSRRGEESKQQQQKKKLKQQVEAVDCNECYRSLCGKIMSTARLRRRIQHADGGKKYERVDSAGSEGLSEPLLGSDYDSALCPNGDGYEYDHWKDKKRKEEMEWSNIFSRLIAQWSQWLCKLIYKLLAQAAVLLGSSSLFGGVVHRLMYRRNDASDKFVDIHLTPLQEDKLRKIQQRLQVPFDGNNADHREALLALWQVAFPDRELTGLVSEQWKDMGWQGSDPSTDFRGGGLISLENLLFFAQRFPRSFARLLFKEEGKRSTWEYPFAVAGINVSFMLIQMLELRSEKPSSLAGLNFLKILAEDESAFDLLYCVAFELMDAQWLALRASYMEFNAVLKATRSQLERELSLEDIHRVQDLPAYNLLCR